MAYKKYFLTWIRFLYWHNTVLLSGLTLQSAKNIVCVVLNAIRFSDIAKGQMYLYLYFIKATFQTTVIKFP